MRKVFVRLSSGGEGCVLSNLFQRHEYRFQKGEGCHKIEDGAPKQAFFEEFVGAVKFVLDEDPLKSKIEAFATTATRLGVRVGKLESTAYQRIGVIKFRSLQEQSGLGVHQHGHPG